MIDPRTVASTFQEFVRQAEFDPAIDGQGQFTLWTDLAVLWQRTATRLLFNTPVEPVIEPSKQDKRFKKRHLDQRMLSSTT